MTSLRADPLVLTPVGGDTLVFYSSPENRSQADWRVMPSASPTVPSYTSRSERGDVVSDGAVHIFVSSVGPDHLGE